MDYSSNGSDENKWVDLKVTEDWINFVTDQMWM